jgi:hypothetical protein
MGEALSVESLTPDHLVEWAVDVEVPPALGFAIRRGDYLAAIGLATWVETPVDPAYPAGWWVWFDSRGPVSPLAHRYAVKIRDALQAAGAQHIHAFMDGEIPKAEAWMRRLGFEPWQQDVWRLTLVVDCEGGRPACVGGGGQGSRETAEGDC